MTGVYRPAVTEFEQVLRVPVFSPRLRATPIPEEDWDSGLIRCFRISEAWIPHILGVLEALDQPDTWLGTDAEIEAARQNVREIMNELAGEGVCEEVPAQYVKSVDCISGGLRIINVIDGVESEQDIDFMDCGAIPNRYIQSLNDCTTGQLQFNEVVNGDVEVTYLNLSACLDGVFVRPGDLPEPAITPVPSLIGTHLWFDTDDNGTPDLDVGQVVYHGTDGTDGTDGITPTLSIIGSNLWADTNADDLYDQNLGKVVGDNGECENCDIIPPPDQDNDPGNEGLMCSIAINEANYLRSLWDKAYNDSDSIMSNYIGAIITGATVIAYFFPGVAVVGAIAGFLLTALKGISQLEANVFDDDLEEKARCTLYCVLKAQDKTVIDQEVMDAWITEFEVGLDAYELFARDLLLYTPLSEFTWIGYASSEIDEAACVECDCPDDPEGWCYEWDFLTSNGGWVNWQPAGRGAAGWVSGSGWHGSSASGGLDAISIRRDFGATVNYTSVQVYFQSPVSGANPSVRWGNYTTLTDISPTPTANPVGFAGTYSATGASLYVNRADGATTNYFNNNWIVKIVLRGTGTLPAALSGGAEC